jgi:cold shock CspA family protein
VGEELDGTLAQWNDERGFGFIEPRTGGPRVFVHVSAFPRDGRRPAVGERLQFRIAIDASGRKQARAVWRPAVARPATRASAARRGSPFGRSLRSAMLVAAVVIGVFGFAYHQPRSRSLALPAEAVTAGPARPFAAPAARFACDGRTHCSQMTSCEEATFFLRNCPGTKMDGDGDGVPCETQWCR